MFKLYSSDFGWKEEIKSLNENEILCAVIGYTNQFESYHLLIIYHDEKENWDIPYKRINNEESLKEYLLDCKERNIELVSKKKKKKKKLVKNK